jgi:hypothetical protein
MPFLEGGVLFTGKLDMLSAYRMRGCSKIVVRRKGGPNPDHIKKGANFANTRHTMSEFGGCSRMGKHVRMTLSPIRMLSDNNFGSDINSIMRQVQLQDATSLKGRRNIILSEHARILEGYPLNKEQPTFDSVMRNPVYYTLDRATRTARVDIPELKRGINYFPQNDHALFRVTVTLGVAPDMRFDIPSNEYRPARWFDPGFNPAWTSTEWYPSLEGMDATTLSLAIDDTPPEEGWTLILSIGIEYGMLGTGGSIKEVKRFGTAKILALRGNDLPAGEGTPGDERDVTQKAIITTEAAPEEVYESGDNVPMPEANALADDDVQSSAMTYVYVATEQHAPVPSPKMKTYTYAYTVPVADPMEDVPPRKAKNVYLPGHLATPDHDRVHHLEHRSRHLHYTWNTLAAAVVWTYVGAGVCHQPAGHVLHLSAGEPPAQRRGYVDDVYPDQHGPGRPPGALPFL